MARTFELWAKVMLPYNDHDGGSMARTCSKEGTKRRTIIKEETVAKVPKEFIERRQQGVEYKVDR